MPLYSCCLFTMVTLIDSVLVNELNNAMLQGMHPYYVPIICIFVIVYTTLEPHLTKQVFVFFPSAKYLKFNFSLDSRNDFI